jgi:hypothetical protein
MKKIKSSHSLSPSQICGILVSAEITMLTSEFRELRATTLTVRDRILALTGHL